ncbi:FAD-dependent oxidoreductase [Nocardioides sp. SYSU D00038]|uniref:FAD-dependent oxidoreductase n=1 Tax=Nocardioides sp. SYSU D00038 TaxID=2812554 RepID=UPI00196740AC|nr:FAD-dependent oxidoreductase [Nocardioides sp. SYSU D00038]
MPHVVTQSCCSDASCVVACPVNCIHPAPGEPGFAEAEMLYVDAAACVDCGACVTACPVGAILPHTSLVPEQQPFVALNAAYFESHPHADRTPVAVVPPQRRLADPRPVRVAVVGAGPAGMYVADELLRHPEVSVDVLDRLPTPYGLVRAGVAPDHPETKRAADLFAAIERQPGFDYLLHVDVGRDLTHDELAAHYDSVVYTVGAADDRVLGIPGEELPGVLSATDVVGWYNGHPDKQDLAVDLDTERVVVVGNGNVALDVARILAVDPATLEPTDLARLPWAQLARSQVREVVVVGRRGPAQAAFSVPELVGLLGVPGVNVVVDDGGAGLDGDDPRSRLLAELATRPVDPELRTVRLRFQAAPLRVLGDAGRVTGLEVARTVLEEDAAGVPRAVATGETEVLEAGLVLRSVGYHGRPVADLPYDAATGTVPSERGRVRPGVYVAGWIKRGPTGFIGTNKSCAQETVQTLLDDLDAGLAPRPLRTRDQLDATLRERGVRVVDAAGWAALDAEERRRGAAAGRQRTKIVDVAEMLRVVEEARAARGYASRRSARTSRARRVRSRS